MKRPPISRMWSNPYTGEYYIVYEEPTPNLAKAFVVALALTIPFWVMS